MGDPWVARWLVGPDGGGGGDSRDGGDSGDGRGIGDSRDSRVDQQRLLALVTDIDESILGEAEVSAKVVDALHPSLAGILSQGTLVDV